MWPTSLSFNRITSNESVQSRSQCFVQCNVQSFIAINLEFVFKNQHWCNFKNLFIFQVLIVRNYVCVWSTSRQWKIGISNRNNNNFDHNVSKLPCIWFSRWLYQIKIFVFSWFSAHFSKLLDKLSIVCCFAECRFGRWDRPVISGFRYQPPNQPGDRSLWLIFVCFWFNSSTHIHLLT